MKAETSQMERNIPSPSEHLERLSEYMGSPSSFSVEETSQSEMDTTDVAALMPLLPEEKNEFLTRRSGHKRWAVVWYAPPVSEAESGELNL
eukprot:g40231.t1